MNLGAVLFTNEKTCDLTSLTAKYFVKNFSNFPIQLTVVSNSLPDNLDKIDGVNYFDAGVKYSSNGAHFKECMLNFIEHCDHDYIFFFCDDYLVYSPIKEKILKEILDCIENFDISMMYLGSSMNLPKNTESINFDNFSILKIDQDYQHALSVQPCIWNKMILKKLLTQNNRVTLHDLDTNIISKEGLELKLYGVHKPPYTFHIDEKPPNSDYLVLDYFEFIRHGFILEAEVNSKKLLRKIIQDNNLEENLKKYT
jgi:hypothetical protein